MNTASLHPDPIPRCDAEIRYQKEYRWHGCGRASTLASRREHGDCTYTLYYCAKHRAQAFGRRALPSVRIIHVFNLISQVLESNA